MGKEKAKDTDAGQAERTTVSGDEPVKSSEVGGEVDELPAE